jgi:hypothetical protein
MPGISPATVYLDDIPKVVGQLLTDFEEPFDGEMLILKNIYLKANEQGRRVVLDGAGGDVLLSPGTYILRLIRAGQIALAVRSQKAASGVWRLRCMI